MAPLLARTARRVARVKLLAGQPRTEATEKAMAAEQREIQLAAQLAADLGSILTQMQRVITHNTAKCHELGAALTKQAELARTWEQRFYTALTVLPELPEEKAPPMVLTGYAAMIRRQHLLQSPDTYAATYPSPYTVPAHV